MKKNIFFAFCAIATAALTLASCDKFLDVMPDNRATINTEEKVQKLLTSAYPENDYMLIAELSSDNVDEYHNTYVASRFIDQVYHWEDVTESNNESPERVWESCYSAISAANHALQALDNIAEENGGEWTASMLEEKGEALMCRAYGHFILVNIFCMNYNTATSGTDLGITYMEAPETQLDPDYDRGNVAGVYAKIDRDIQEGLKLIGDSYYTVPKYHFNPKAAYAFAARFYLYYEKWEECIKYADLCLGAAPKTMLRNYSEVAGMTSSFAAYSNEYINANLNCNLLLLTAYSTMGTTFGPYTTNKKYAHGNYLAVNETAKTTNVWGTNNDYYLPIKSYSGTNREYNVFWRLPYLFEYTDAVAGIGYNRTVYPAFSADECLLNRAEAYILLKDYDKALADMNLWVDNQMKNKKTLTAEMITNFYNAIDYSYSDIEGKESTLKKHLNPGFAIDAEGSTQECMLHCILGMRRVECMPMGIRWFDVKRYGIEIIRRTMTASGIPEERTDVLSKDDPRRAMQLSTKVLEAGVKPNPRNK